MLSAQTTPIRSCSPARTGFALAVLVAGAAAVTSAAAPPTGLAPGKAKGTITVNGKAVTLTHAYAALEPTPSTRRRATSSWCSRPVRLRPRP
jgi:hypothetical protein